MSSKVGTYDVSTQSAKPAETSSWLYIATVAAVISASLPGGYNISVLNAPQSILVSFCNESLIEKYDMTLTEGELNLLWSVVVAVFLLGGVIGSLTAGWLCNRWGRKMALEFCNLVGLISAVLFFGSKGTGSVEMILLGRVLIGYSTGFSAGAVPLYLTEIAPSHLRGQFGTLHMFGLNLGLLLAQILGLKALVGTEELWHVLLSLYAIPIIICGIILWFCPESPTYSFVQKGLEDQALADLSRLRGKPVDELGDDVMELKKEQKTFRMAASWNVSRLLEDKTLRFGLLIVCSLHAGQQLAGINAVMYYSTSIFMSAGISLENSQYASIGAGLANFFMAALSIVLVKSYGRRPLVLISTALSAVCLIILVFAISYMEVAQIVAYIAVFGMLAFVVTYGLGLGPIAYFIGSELFAPGPRPTAMSLGVMFNFTANFLVALSFPTLQKMMGQFSFLVFIIFLVCFFVFLYRMMPETKISGQANPEIQSEATTYVFGTENGNLNTTNAEVDEIQHSNGHV